MLMQAKAERGMVYNLLRRPGEHSDETLARFAQVPADITPEYVEDQVLARIFQLVLDNAYNELSTGTKLVAQELGIDEFDLIQAVEAVDPDALLVYAEAVRYHYSQRQVRAAAKEAVEISNTHTPSDALDQIAARFANVTLQDDEARIGTVVERNDQGREAMRLRQEELSAGVVRMAFPQDGLNEMVYLLPGEMILLTAFTKVGKSTFAGQFFDFNVKRGMRGLYFHFEDRPSVMDARRVARQLQTLGQDAPSYKQVLGGILSGAEQEMVDEVREDIASWGHLGTEIYCAEWTMAHVVRVWKRLALRAQAEGDPIKFVIVDYLNKAEIPPKNLKEYGLFGSRGRDAELVKRAAEATGVTALLVQQEGPDGSPYETKQSAQKSQVWLRLVREKVDDYRLDTHGKAIIAYANSGETGAIDVMFLPKRMLWAEL